MWIIVLSAVLGLIVTLAADSEPGDLLGVFLIAGTLVAAIAVRVEAVHVIIPAPALVFLTAGVIAGLVHDWATEVTSSALAVSALQWIAGGFLAMTAATLLAIAVTVARRLRTRTSIPARTSVPQRRHRPRDPDHWDFE